LSRERETWVIGKGGAKRGGERWGIGQVGEEVCGLLGFVARVCVCMYVCCFSDGCLCQGL
jgi:hypothetical protein